MKDFSERRTRGERIRELVRKYVERLRRRGEPEQPDDPYAYVTAPKKPRPNQGSTSAVAELPEE